MILTFFARKDLLDKCEALSKFIVKLRTEQSVKMIEPTKTRKFNFYNKCSKVDSVNLNSRATRSCIARVNISSYYLSQDQLSSSGKFLNDSIRLFAEC